MDSSIDNFKTEQENSIIVKLFRVVNWFDRKQLVNRAHDKGFKLWNVVNG